MPTKTSKTYSSFYGNDLAVNQSGNTGVDATTREVQDGFGNNTAISLSDDVLKVQPVNDNTARTLEVKDQGGDAIFSVNTSTSQVLAGASGVNVTTLFKDMGLFDFSPTAGVHNPLIANNMMFSESGSDYAEDTSFGGTGTDPATSHDVSAGDELIAVASYWYLDNDITLDSVRFMATCDTSATLNFHLFAYDLDVSSNHGDLSNGVVHANATVSATATTVKTGTFTLDTANIDASKVVVGFVENATDTGDITTSVQIKYHIR